MLVLGVDSSSNAATAAVVRDGELLCEYTQNQKKTHSVKMLPMVEAMLADLDLSVADIDVFACGIGPGSFTGVRIGAATVRGFADTLSKPCVAVTSLEALHDNVKYFDGTVFSLVFARENECYAAIYKNGEEMVAPCVMTVDDIAAYAKGKKCLFVGDGAIANYEVLANIKNATIAETRHNIISAGSIALLGYYRALTGDTGDTNVLSPLYLRKSQAEREYDEKHKSEER